MNLVKKNTKFDLSFFTRPDTTDDKVITEVVERQVYRRIRYQNKPFDFDVKPGETWLDLGGNIGTFSCLALAKGAKKVISFEPETDNFNILKKNLELNGFDPARYTLHKKGVASKTGKTKLYLSKNDYNKYRHSIFPKSGRPYVEIDLVSITKVLNSNIDGVKIDIEGAEVEILEKVNNWKNVSKLVFEYSFDIFPSVARFKNIISNLKKHFKVVNHPKLPPGLKEYNFYPPAVVVYCLGSVNNPRRSSASLRRKSVTTGNGSSRSAPGSLAKSKKILVSKTAKKNIPQKNKYNYFPIPIHFKSHNLKKKDFQKIIAEKKQFYPESIDCSSDSTYTIITKPTFIYKADGKTPLAVFLKGGIVDPTLLKIGREYNMYTRTTTFRPKLSGKDGFRMNAEGRRMMMGKPVKSGLVGFSDPTVFHPCRITSLYKLHREYFDSQSIHLLRYLSNEFKKFAPDHYKRQKKFLDTEVNPKMILDGTVFTTITVNDTFKTRSHRDSGDFNTGLGNLVVFNQNGEKTWSGGEFLLPEYKLGFDVQEGDILFVDVHEVHCNNPVIGKGRISVISYVREKIATRCKDFKPNFT